MGIFLVFWYIVYCYCEYFVLTLFIFSSINENRLFLKLWSHKSLETITNFNLSKEQFLLYDTALTGILQKFSKKLESTKFSDLIKKRDKWEKLIIFSWWDLMWSLANKSAQKGEVCPRSDRRSEKLWEV